MNLTESQIKNLITLYDREDIHIFVKGKCFDSISLQSCNWVHIDIWVDCEPEATGNTQAAHFYPAQDEDGDTIALEELTLEDIQIFQLNTEFKL